MSEDASTNGSSQQVDGRAGAAPVAPPAGLPEIATEIRGLREALEALRSQRELPPPVHSKTSVSAPRPLTEYRERLVEIGRDHLNGPEALGKDVSIEQVVTAMRILANAAAITDVCSVHGNEMWPTAQSALTVAVPHYKRVVRAAEATGVVDALAADDYYVLRTLQADLIPEEDLDILKMAGVEEPGAYLRAMSRRANAAPDLIKRIVARAPAQAVPEKELLRAAVAEGEGVLLEMAKTDAKKPAPKRKIWSGIGKILRGAAVAGGNLVPLLAAAGIYTINPMAGVMAAAGAAPRLDKLLTSCGAGAGEIFEGIGAIRGE